MPAAELDLPAWACVTDERRAHIARVMALLDRWATALRVSPAEGEAWRDAGRWHDALRDAPDAELRRLVPASDFPPALLHGPAAAARLEADGETRMDVLEAVRWHTVGYPHWSRTGKALFMADFLEPGRAFAKREREALAEMVTRDFDGAFREVVRQRMKWARREEKILRPETVALWNSLR